MQWVTINSFDNKIELIYAEFNKPISTTKNIEERTIKKAKKNFENNTLLLNEYTCKSQI